MGQRPVNNLLVSVNLTPGGTEQSRAAGAQAYEFRPIWPRAALVKAESTVTARSGGSAGASGLTLGASPPQTLAFHLVRFGHRGARAKPSSQRSQARRRGAEGSHPRGSITNAGRSLLPTLVPRRPRTRPGPRDNRGERPGAAVGQRGSLGSREAAASAAPPPPLRRPGLPTPQAALQAAAARTPVPRALRAATCEPRAATRSHGLPQGHPSTVRQGRWERGASQMPGPAARAPTPPRPRPGP